MSFEIKIEGEGKLGYFITRDTCQWILTHRTPPKNDKNKLGYNEKQTYYASLEQVLVAIMERKAGKASTLEEVIKNIKDFKKLVKGIVIK